MKETALNAFKNLGFGSHQMVQDSVHRMYVQSTFFFDEMVGRTTDL